MIRYDIVTRLAKASRKPPVMSPLTLRRHIMVQNDAKTTRDFQDSLNLLKTKGTSRMAVTEFITQYDELRQIRRQVQQEPATASMVRGTQLHAVLEANYTADPAQALVQIGDAEVDMRTAALFDMVNKLHVLAKHGATQEGVVREIPLRALAPHGTCVLKGVIDCIYVSNQGLVIMETKTTRKVAPYFFRIAYHQALTYHWLLKSIVLGDPAVRSIDNLITLFKIVDKDVEFVSEILAMKERTLHETFSRLADIGFADVVNLQFMSPIRTGEWQEEIYEMEYDEKALLKMLESREDLFAGRRDPYAFMLPDIAKDLLSITDESFTVGNCSDSQKVALKI